MAANKTLIAIVLCAVLFCATAIIVTWKITDTSSCGSSQRERIACKYGD